MAVFANPVAHTERDLINNASKALEGLFAPPSAQDVYAYSRARKANTEAANLADLYARAQDPNFSQDTFDRLGQAAGQWTPSTGYYGVDQNNARALAQTQMEQQGQTQRQLLEPITLSENQTAYLPTATAEATGLGASPLVGMYTVGKDEVANVPGVGGVAGVRSPMTSDQLKASIMASADPAAQGAWAFGSTPIENVRTADGSTQILTRPQALEAGPGAISYNASLQGGASETGLAPTKTNLTQANSMDAELVGVQDTINRVRDLATNNPGLFGAAGRIRGVAQDAVQTVSELAQAFGEDNPQLVAFAQDVNDGLGRVAASEGGVATEYFDPNIPKARKLMLELAYANARIENPTGEVSRQALERSIEALGAGGLLSSNASVLAGLDAMQDSLNARRQSVDRLRNPQPVSIPTPTPAPTGVPADIQELWEYMTPEERALWQN